MSETPIFDELAQELAFGEPDAELLTDADLPGDDLAESDTTSGEFDQMMAEATPAEADPG